VRISNLLFTPPTFTPSAPAECDKMTRLGFAFSWEDRRVNESLINCAKSEILANPDSDWLKQELGTAYDVSITIKDITFDHMVATLGSVPVDAKEVVMMHRLATVVKPDNSTYIAAFNLSLYVPK
jgi:hypothetical protein